MILTSNEQAIGYYIGNIKDTLTVLLLIPIATILFILKFSGV